MNHTTGPWETWTHDGGETWTVSSRGVADVATVPASLDVDAATAAANARLIAAAPEMLAALERIAGMRNLPIGDQSEEMGSRLQAASIALDAALNARGPA